MSHAGVENNDQPIGIGFLEREVSVGIGPTLQQLLPLTVQNGDGSPLHPFAAAEFAFGIDPIPFRPSKDGYLMRLGSGVPQKHHHADQTKNFQ